MSTIHNKSDQWVVEVSKDHGPLYRNGHVTIEYLGQIEARSLWIKAVSVFVEADGKLILDEQGNVGGK